MGVWVQRVVAHALVMYAGSWWQRASESAFELPTKAPAREVCLEAVAHAI